MAALPSASSMRSRRLYLQTRSLRQGAPVLIDPLVSRAKLCTVKAETDIFYLGSLNDEWAYVMVETADGRWMCGFMPHEDISNG